MNFLGIDVGTSGTRAVLIDTTGAIVASATAEHAAFASPQAGWAEQDPRDWWRACQQALRTLVKMDGVDADTIAAVGLSGQMHGTAMLDAKGDVQRPALIWCDQRTEVECAEITARVGREKLIELTCNPALTGFSLPKMLWVRRHEPEIWQRVKTVLLPKDYVRMMLSGERATDVADASGTLLLDVAARRWSSEMLAALELNEDLLPRVFESHEVTGAVSIAAAAVTGLKAGTPIVAGGGDQAAGAVGMGIVEAGNVSATIGTSGVVFAATDKPALDPHGRVHTFCHAVADAWHVMGVTQAAGLSLRWFRDQFALRSDTGPESYDALMQVAASAPVGSDGVLWAPYLMGERTPHLDPNARAALVGLTASHTRAHVVRAILEGVAFSLRDTFEIFAEMAVPVRRVILGGGGARSAVWRQIQADVYGHDVETVAAEEGAAYGAALLAGVGAGAWPSVPDACKEVVKTATRISTAPASVALLSERYAAYKSIYPALRAIR